MISLKLGETLIERNGNRVYFIAEIGQNHQGSLKIAKEMILEAKVSNSIEIMVYNYKIKFVCFAENWL